jgi:predicted patatin/cPLA2 family phospholipase
MPRIIKKLQESLDNIVEHFKNNHQNYSAESRCICDSNYEPSKLVIKESNTERIKTTTDLQNSRGSHHL